MSEIQKLIDAAERLCQSLDIASVNDKKYNDDICAAFEKMSHDMEKMKTDLYEIKGYLQ